MKILITGSNGLLGQKLVALLTTEKVRVIATSKGVDRLPPSKGAYTFTTLDITNQKEVDLVISTHKPDCVINTAAMTNVDQAELEQDACWNLNVNAVAHLINACQKN